MRSLSSNSLLLLSLFSINAHIPVIDFDQSNKRYETEFSCMPHTYYNVLKELYNTNIKLDSIIDSNLHIPKIIHIIWLGGKPPQHVMDCYNSFKEFHPDWAIHLWTDEDTCTLSLQNKLLFAEASNYGQKADILRYELLYQFGGLYVDADMICLKPFNSLHEKYYFYTALADPCVIGIGMIGSIPGHPILERVINTLSLTPKNQNAHNIVIETTGNYHFERCFFETLKNYDEKVIVFPCTYFYPSHAAERFTSIAAQKTFIKSESYSIHFWKTEWLKPPKNYLLHDLYNLQVYLENLGDVLIDSIDTATDSSQNFEDQIASRESTPACANQQEHPSSCQNQTKRHGPIAATIAFAKDALNIPWM